jgi:hypothetical protein
MVKILLNVNLNSTQIKKSLQEVIMSQSSLDMQEILISTFIQIAIIMNQINLSLETATKKAVSLNMIH